MSLGVVPLRCCHIEADQRLARPWYSRHEYDGFLAGVPSRTDDRFYPCGGQVKVARAGVVARVTADEIVVDAGRAL